PGPATIASKATAARARRRDLEAESTGKGALEAARPPGAHRPPLIRPPPLPARSGAAPLATGIAPATRRVLERRSDQRGCHPVARSGYRRQGPRNGTRPARRTASGGHPGRSVRDEGEAGGQRLGRIELPRGARRDAKRRPIGRGTASGEPVPERAVRPPPRPDIEGVRADGGADPDAG